MSIAILIPLCSRNQTWVNVNDIDYFNNFLPFFFQSISNKFTYKFYLGVDENDKFLMDNLDLIKKKIHPKWDSVHVMPKTLNKNPYGIWNKLLEHAVADSENEYFYQVGSDIMHVTKYWDRYFVNVLKKNKNIGFCGGVDKRFWYERLLLNQNGILENVFFHKTHYEIFNRFINEKFSTWFGDDYLSQIYREVDSTFICPLVLYSNQNRVGDSNQKNRYEPTTEMQHKWKNIAIKDSKIIKEYIKNNNLELLY